MTLPLSDLSPTSAGAPDVHGTLERCRGLVNPALRATVRRLPPEIGRMVEFTLGWRNADGTPSEGRGGKGLRPAFAVLAAQAVGGDPAAAVPGAVAVELVHVFSLVHDDIMDGDERRRHRLTAWKAYGVGPAVLAGDALLAIAMDSLARATPPAVSGAAVTRLTSALVELVNGQAADLSFELRPWRGPQAVTAEEYSSMAERKTGSLLGCAAGLGALLGGAPDGAVADLTRMGRHLGLAFQAVDDLLGIWGDPAVTGKPVHSDLRKRKKTLPVVSALAVGGPAAERLAELLDPAAGDGAPAQDGDGGDGGEEAWLQEAAAAIADAGGRDSTAASAEHHLQRARQLIADTAQEPTAAAALVQLAEFAAHRSH